MKLSHLFSAFNFEWGKCSDFRNQSEVNLSSHCLQVEMKFSEGFELLQGVDLKAEELARTISYCESQLEFHARFPPPP